MEGKDSVGQRLYCIRQSLGMSRQKLADELHLSCSHLANLENGNRRINIEQLIQLHIRYGISADYLLFGTRAVLSMEDIRYEDIASGICGISEREKILMSIKLLESLI